MKEVHLTEATAALPLLVDRAVAGEPAVITRDGKREVVVLSYREYERLSRPPSLGWLLVNSPLEADDLGPSHKPARALRDAAF